MKEIVTIVLSLIAFGCVTNDVYNRSKDPARYIMRHCPVQRVYGDELDIAVRDAGKWIKGDNVKVGGDGYCTFNSVGIKKWAESNGIPCETKDVMGGAHRTIAPEGCSYYLDPVRYTGIIVRRLSYYED